MFSELKYRTMLIIASLFGQHRAGVDYDEDTKMLCVTSVRFFRDKYYVLDVTWFRYHPDAGEFVYLKSNGNDQ